MSNKVSDITVEEIAAYIRLDVDEASTAQINIYLKIAKDFIKNYTGLTDSEMDEYADLIIVVYVLCQDMYDNRALYVDGKNLNRMVQTVLDMHRRVFL